VAGEAPSAHPAILSVSVARAQGEERAGQQEDEGEPQDSTLIMGTRPPTAETTRVVKNRLRTPIAHSWSRAALRALAEGAGRSRPRPRSPNASAMFTRTTSHMAA
jgi:hypothetical protein